MPSDTCTECGQEAVPGPVPDEGQPFLCCDCDLELATYANVERTELQETTRLRLKALNQTKTPLGRRASLMDKARMVLTTRTFSPEGDARSAVKILTDNEQTYFAGMGATDLWPSVGPLALHLAEVIPAEETEQMSSGLPSKLSILELGAGAGAPGLWIWKKRHPNVKVCLTEVPRLVPLLELSCEANFAFDGMSQQPFRWSVQGDASAFDDRGDVWDLIIAADACYNEDKSFPLMEAITRISPVHGAILAQSLHSEAEDGGEAAIRAMQERAEEAGWSFQRIKVMDTGIAYCEENWRTAIIRLLPPVPSSKQTSRSRRSRYETDEDIKVLAEVRQKANIAGSSQQGPAPFWSSI